MPRGLSVLLALERKDAFVAHELTEIVELSLAKLKTLDTGLSFRKEWRLVVHLQAVVIVRGNTLEVRLARSAGSVPADIVYRSAANHAIVWAKISLKVRPDGNL